ncbi:MAG TPA: MoxR family ATPase, partial [Chloroflexota bacterium]|nr:MoxR family ATPase [Chloroflexota bacterium]
RRFRESNPLVDVEPTLRAEDVDALARICRQVYISDAVEGYIIDLVRTTRAQNGVSLGASPRATLALCRASQAIAAIDGRGYVLPDDVKRLAAPILGHRLILSTRGRLDGRSATDVVGEILRTVPAPVEDVDDGQPIFSPPGRSESLP